MLWKSITDSLSFTGITDASVWQHIILSSVLIPIVLLISRYIYLYWNDKRPLKSLLRGFLKSKGDDLIFVSQLSGALDDFTFNNNQKYISKYLFPLPNNKSNICEARLQNIDPVWSESDGECLADVYCVLGQAGIKSGIRIGSLIRDWESWGVPAFTIGFSARTIAYMRLCEPIYFDLEDYCTLNLKGKHIYAEYPCDGAIIQKTNIKDAKTPIIILAGLGTTGTSCAGYFFRECASDLGKLYGDKMFAVLLQGDANCGRSSASVCGMYPKPRILNRLIYPLTYSKYSKWFIEDKT